MSTPKASVSTSGFDLLQFLLDGYELGSIGGNQHYSLYARLHKYWCNAFGTDTPTGTGHNDDFALQRVFLGLSGLWRDKILGVSFPGKLTRCDNPVFWKGGEIHCGEACCMTKSYLARLRYGA